MTEPLKTHIDDVGDTVCEHGTAVDVHCCNCHNGFIFDLEHECPPVALASASSSPNRKTALTSEARQQLAEGDFGQPSSKAYQWVETLVSELESASASASPHPETIEVIVNGQPVTVKSGTVRDVISQAVRLSGQIGAPIAQWQLRTTEGDVIPHDLSDGTDYELTPGRRLWLNLGPPVPLPASSSPQANRCQVCASIETVLVPLCREHLLASKYTAALPASPQAKGEPVTMAQASHLRVLNACAAGECSDPENCEERYPSTLCSRCRARLYVSSLSALPASHQANGEETWWIALNGQGQIFGGYRSKAEAEKNTRYVVGLIPDQNLLTVALASASTGSGEGWRTSDIRAIVSSYGTCRGLTKKAASRMWSFRLFQTRGTEMDEAVARYWSTHYVGSIGVCVLCGNSGRVDTTGKATSPLGVACGAETYCFCPNGQKARELKLPLEGLRRADLVG